MGQVIQQDTHTVIITGYKKEDVQVTAKSLPGLGWVPILPVITSRDFPGAPVVKNPPCNAGDAGSIPGQETKISHAAEQLSP